MKQAAWIERLAVRAGIFTKEEASRAPTHLEKLFLWIGLGTGLVIGSAITLASLLLLK